MSVIRSLLLVDDSDDDEFFFRHALEQTGRAVQFARVRDGLEAIAALQHEAPFDDPEIYATPDLIFTDLNMPRCDGMEFLKWLRRSQPHRLTPVMVVSSSAMPRDIWAAHDLGANAFITKPNTLPELTKILNIVLEFWRVCQAPHNLLYGSASSWSNPAQTGPESPDAGYGRPS